MAEPNGEPDLRQQLRQARLELERQLRAGQDVRAEHILARYPALAADPDSALEIIYSTEFTLRKLRGEEPTPAEYYERFPHYRRELEELFRLGDLMVGEDQEPASPHSLDLPVENGTDWGVEHFEGPEPLGQHGPVVVFKARQLSRNRLVAIKMVAKDQTPPPELDRFRRGRDNQAGLRHPHIVQVYDVGEDEDEVFFTMEYGAGGTLAQRIAGRPLPADEAARILHVLAGAVEYAHAKGILHRDLKPANVVLTADGTPKITDFGLAKRLEAESSLTRSGDLLGTPPYMAPEQVEGRTDLGARTDVYGLGAVLYETLTGRPPFQGKNELDTLLQVRRCRVVLPRRHNRAVDRRLESICLRCLEKRPRRRYSSARALADDLERWQHRGRPRAHSVATRGGRLVRRHPVAAMFHLLVLAVLAVVAFRYITSEERALRLALGRLARGEAVTWIGNKGGPISSRIVLPYGDALIGQADDGSFVFGSKTLGLLELVPDPQHSHYVLTAEVRRNEDKPASDFGFYLLHSQYPAGPTDSWNHWYWVVCFNDCQMAYWDRLRIGIEHHFQPSNMRQTNRFDATIQYLRTTVKVWHRFAADISPEGIRLEWDGQLINASRGNLDERLDVLAKDTVKPMTKPSPLTPRSPLGLYASDGSACFRNVVVKPVTPFAGE
jgi:serine/threonine-protein kinase